MESRGISFQQDPFHKNKLKKLFASKVFPKEFSVKVDLTRVALARIRPWIEKKVAEVMGGEDEIVSEYCVAQLEAYDPIERTVDPRELQINLEGFLGVEGSASLMEELWSLLISAQDSPSGVPKSLVDEEEREERLKREAEIALQREIQDRREQARLEKEKEIIKRETERRESDRDHNRRRRSRSVDRGRRRSRSRDRRSRSRDRRPYGRR
jgi:serine/arginine repetitive matrix protein 1